MHREGVARRDVLKRLGVAAGVAWAAPVLTTMRTPASASALGTPNPQQCAGATCVSFTPCSTNFDCVCPVAKALNREFTFFVTDGYRYANLFVKNTDLHARNRLSFCVQHGAVKYATIVQNHIGGINLFPSTDLYRFTGHQRGAK